jgi:hypothetical protein
MTLVSIAMITLGFIGESLIHNISLIIGGTYFGHVLTEALNNPTEESL